MKLFKKIIKIVTNTILVLLFILLGLILFAKVKMLLNGNNYFELFGYSIFEVATGSMAPSINQNDIIITKKNNNYEVNDVITFSSDNSYITHRIIGINNNEFITKGDANNTVDKPVNIDNVVGKVIKIYPNLGIWKEVLSNPKILILILVTLILFDVAFSYDNKKVKVKKLNKENKINEEVKKEIKNNIDSLEEDYTIRLDLGMIQKNINDKINRN